MGSENSDSKSDTSVFESSEKHLIETRLYEPPSKDDGDAASPTKLASSKQSVDSSVPLKTLRPGCIIDNRYLIAKPLGEGGFGAVFLAHDQELGRDVAIKCSTRLSREVAEQVRAEAKAIAAFSHPGIVAIYDLIRDEDNNLLIVMEYVPGETLRTHLRKGSIDTQGAAEIAAQIAEALIHAHSRKLIHRDLKPSNVLIDSEGRVRLLDFGLAIGQFPETMLFPVGGTPGYMSPEQARAETHRIDGRSDVWGLGVMLYEMLTSQSPFPGRNPQSRLEKTVRRDPPPPRQLDSSIPRELDRICMKCLSKRMAGRYSSAADVANDLREWIASAELPEPSGDGSRSDPSAPEPQASSSSSKTSLAMLTRGLRPFSEEESESYWQLIPGPRDRNGIPESIRFWKQWVESDDPDSQSPVGVLYGPSGSGKSSFVRAGLLRHIDEQICCVYVECRPGDLGGRIARIISSKIESDPTSSSSLRDLLTHFRSDDDVNRNVNKILVVLDQFEAWAHCASYEERLAFADALRQCDGVHIRALVVVRDDFWMGVSELMQWLELPLEEGRNANSIEPLDRNQAEHVLELLGRAYGSLPSEPESLSYEQQQFIEQSVRELTVGDRVICVHLVMFAQMVRLRNWHPRHLKQSGGVVGACIAFMQDLFSPNSTTSPPSYRRLSKSVALVIEELLPPVNQSVHTHRCSRDELKEKLEHAEQSRLFDDTLKVLSDDLKIITVAVDDEPVNSTDGTVFYQVSHDFLVQPLTAWIDIARKSTRKGRALARLQEMSQLWSQHPQKAFLPSMSEWVAMKWSTNARLQSKQERDYLRAASRLHTGRASVAFVAFLVFVIMSIALFKQNRDSRIALRRQVETEVYSLLNGPASDVTVNIETLVENREIANPLVEKWTESVEPQFALRARLYQNRLKPETFDQIADGIETAPPDLFSAVLDAAKTSSNSVAQLTKLYKESANAAVRSRAAILLVYLGETNPAQEMLAFTPDASDQTSFIKEACQWRGVHHPWTSILRDPKDDGFRYAAAIILGTYSKGTWTDEIPIDDLLESPKQSQRALGEWLATRFTPDKDFQAIGPPSEADWMVTPSGIPMVRLPGGEFQYPSIKPNELITNSIDDPFYIATIPIPRSMYVEFFDEVKQLDNGSPIKSHPYEGLDQQLPATGFDAHHAVSFCNWLSRKDGLTPAYRWKKDQPQDEIKSFADAARLVKKKRPWEILDDSNGYLLPTAMQHSYATRCGVAGSSWGAVKPIYEAVGNDPETFKKIHLARTLIPNRWGLFMLDPKVGTWTYGKEGTERSFGLSAIYQKKIDSLWFAPSQRGGINAIFLVQRIE